MPCDLSTGDHCVFVRTVRVRQITYLAAVINIVFNKVRIVSQLIRSKFYGN